MSAPENRRSIDTQAVQAASIPQQGEATPAVPPITPSVGYIHPAMEDSDAALAYLGGTPFDPDRYVYARYGGPTQAALEQATAELEGAESAVSFSSGMSALHAGLLALVPAGGRIVAAEQLYGVTRTLLNWMGQRMGIDVRFADFLNLDAARAAINDAQPDAVICEVLTNPLIQVVEVDAIAEAAQAAGSRLLVDNTFATPLLLRPLEIGADAVVHSTTKFLNGHGDVLGGVVAGTKWDMQQAYELRKMLGAMPSAFDAWLVLRGMRTLAVRMRQACANAAKLAAWLAEREDIARVNYPGLPDDPGHEVAHRLFGGEYYGSMLAFEVAGLDRASAFRFVERLKLIRRVTSLGDVFSIVLHPASSSHRALTPEQRAAQGITEGVLRLSVGIEGADDLMADIAQALDG